MRKVAVTAGLVLHPGDDPGGSRQEGFSCTRERRRCEATKVIIEPGNLGNEQALGDR